MIDYKTARFLAEAEIKNRVKPPFDQVTSALELEDAFVFDYGNPELDEPAGQYGLEVSKQDGKITDFILPDKRNFERLDHAKELKI